MRLTTCIELIGSIEVMVMPTYHSKVSKAAVPTRVFASAMACCLADGFAIATAAKIAAKPKAMARARLPI